MNMWESWNEIHFASQNLSLLLFMTKQWQQIRSYIQISHMLSIFDKKLYMSMLMVWLNQSQMNQ